MTDTVGWKAALWPIMRAAQQTRSATPFDAKARLKQVEAEVEKARKFPWWPLCIGVVGLALPMAGIWVVAGVGWWIAGVVRAGPRADARTVELKAETDRLEQRARDEAEQLADFLARAEHGHIEAYRELLRRWTVARPPLLADVVVDLTDERRSDGSLSITITATAIPRSRIPEGIPRAERGGRQRLDKRKAAEIDEDLSQINAAAVASVLIALFGGSTRRRIAVRQSLRTEDGTGAIDWVTLDTVVNESVFGQAFSADKSPVDWIRALGGDVGRCKAKRYTAAMPSNPDAPTKLDARSPASNLRNNLPPLPSTSAPPRAAAAPNVTTAREPFGASITAALTFGETAPSGASRVPAPPPQFVGRSSADTPTIQGVRNGSFSEVARRFKDYSGDPSARFVAFEQYWATYAHMAPGQLKFYFKWRNAVRNGEAPRTDLSYVFVHVYELLHLIGASGPDDAADRLERVWCAYRPTFKKLDNYLVTWIVDLLISEGRRERAMTFIDQAVCNGVSGHGQEETLIVDRFWERGDYDAMPLSGIAMLAGDPRLGENKFYVLHNASTDGDGWVDRVYRDALRVTDRVVTAKERRSPRELEIARSGLVDLSRETFASAVYDYRRKPVSLGKVPRLTNDSATIALYRNAVRYAENFLRKEKAFAAKLRGIAVSSDLAAALDKHLAEYVRKTKPRPRVVIDLERAADLARDSADVRARLLAGLESSEGAASQPDLTRESTPEAPSGAAEGQDMAAVNAPAGLLTDLAAIRTALSKLSSPALAVLEALVACDWEATPGDSRLANAASGALVGPLLDEINSHADEAVGDVLIVHEDDTVVVQEDFRDEVFWVLRGTLDGFADSSNAAASSTKDLEDQATPSSAHLSSIDSDGFGPIELEVLVILHSAIDGTRADSLAAVARNNATTPTLLVDRVNESALSSSYGDILVEQDGDELRILDEAVTFVADLVARTNLSSPTFES